MSSKDTKKDRREEAKRARIEAQRKAQRRAAMKKVYGAVAAVVVIALIVFLVANGGKKGSEAKTRLTTEAAAAGCGKVQENIATVGEENGQHHVVPPNQQDITAPDPQTADSVYNTNPPTNGPHYNLGNGVAPAKTGVHLNAIPNGAQIHNLEHGHVGIQYTSKLPEAVRTALEQVARDHDTGAFIAPREGMQQQLAFTAWRTLLTCNAPTDAAAIKKVAEDFYTVYFDKAPEHVTGVPQ